MKTGINFTGREYKLSQYVDVCFARDEKSVEKLFEKLEAFKGFCGLELNRSKTETLWLGKIGSQPTNLSVQHINWPTKCVCLGLFFSIDWEAFAKDNFEKK